MCVCLLSPLAPDAELRSAGCFQQFFTCGVNIYIIIPSRLIRTVWVIRSLDITPNPPSPLPNGYLTCSAEISRMQYVTS